VPNDEGASRNAVSHVVDIYLLAAPTVPPYLVTPPFHPAPLACQPPYPLANRSLLVILMGPGTHGNMGFFGWSGIAHMHLWSELGNIPVLIHESGIYRCNSKHAPRMAVSCIVDSCLLVPPTCPTAPPYIFDPALPSGTLGKSTTLPAYLKNIISNPNQPRHHGITPFTSVFWVVGNTRCGLIIWFRQVLGIHISG